MPLFGCMRTFAHVCMIAVSGLLLGCKIAAPGTGKIDAQQDPVEGMVFLTFSMRNDSISGKEIRLISKIIVPQKQKFDPVNADAPNKLIINQTNDSGKILSTTAVDHPLLRRVELADDEGKFQSRNLFLKEAEFAVRVTLYRETEYIQVTEELNGKVAYSTKFKIRD